MVQLVAISIYTIIGYWAVNKVLYEDKIIIYSDGFALFEKKLVYALFLGWLFIPIAIIKSIIKGKQ